MKQFVEFLPLDSSRLNVPEEYQVGVIDEFIKDLRDLFPKMQMETVIFRSLDTSIIGILFEYEAKESLVPQVMETCKFPVETSKRGSAVLSITQYMEHKCPFLNETVGSITGLPIDQGILSYSVAEKISETVQPLHGEKFAIGHKRLIVVIDQYNSSVLAQLTTQLSLLGMNGWHIKKRLS